jgi:hypothetical protein
MANQPVRRLDDEPRVRVRREGGGTQSAARIFVQGCLDETNGRTLTAAVDSLANGGLAHIRVDLRAITGFTQDGVSAASECCEQASRLPCGVSFLVCTGASRSALLEIFART